MTTFDSAFEEIQNLVDDFEKGISYYLRPEYSEAQVRLDFINKFFIALGWDVRNDNRSNPLQREVVIEKSQRQQQSKAQKRADYAFYVAPDFKNISFFVEAKKPCRNLKNADDYFQTARYAWNAGTGVSILTDFEELHIIDCRFKPDISKVFNAHNKTMHFTDYRDKEKFALLYWLFSKEAAVAGNIQKYVADLPKPKKGAVQTTLFAGKWQSIDESFLEYIDGIRETLAKAFKKNDNSLDSGLLTEAVTRTIDRLVFMRFLEDKLIEPENHVSEFGNRTTAWKDFINTCRVFDAKYNGAVFKKHFIDGQNFSGADDAQFKNICSGLSHLNSPYDFNAIPIHILGSIYERFLGKVVMATGKRVTIEEKPEVRKAGGVYYTPEYIVDYIVKNTVGKLIEGKKPADIAKLKFADIACGSGSFLIGVLDCLLTYHTAYYNQHPEEAKHDKCLKVDGLYVLSIQQKQKILTNNIYGVDIDHQATEVTQLSLYLKMLEDETTATANEMQVLFHEKILPNLSHNIKCGNSLIGTDILNNQLFSFEEERKLNPFDFAAAFPEVFKNGGFDAVVGNPPYDVLEKERLGLFSPHDFLQVYVKKNKALEPALGGKLNLYRFFIVKGFQLIKENGKFGLIIPLSIVGDKSCFKTREYLIQNSKELAFDCFPQKDNPQKRIFVDAKLSTCIFLSTKSSNKKSENLKFIIKSYPHNSFKEEHKECEIEYDKLKIIDNKNLPIPLINQNEGDLLYKLHSINNNSNFSNVKEVIIRRGEINQTIYRKYITSIETENERLIKGVQIGPYKFNKKLSQGIIEWFDEKKYFKENSIKEIASLTRIATQRITGVDERLRLVATIISPKAYFADSTNSIHLTKESKYSLEYILGLINSKLFQWRFKLTSTNNNVGTNEIESLPFRQIDFKNKSEVDLHSAMTNLVTQLLSAKKQLPTIQSSRDKEYLERKCETLDSQIDKLVYELYGISEEEVKIIEGT